MLVHLEVKFEYCFSWLRVCGHGRNKLIETVATVIVATARIAIICDCLVVFTRWRTYVPPNSISICSQPFLQHRQTHTYDTARPRYDIYSNSPHLSTQCMRCGLKNVTGAINQSIKIYFLSNRNITVYTVYASAQKAAREAYAH